jgi:protease I
MDTINGKKIAMMATDGFEQSELEQPKRLLESAGATVDVISPKAGTIKGWNHTNWGNDVPVDKTLESVSARDYDAIVLPGGVMNPDRLRMEPKAIEFIRDFYNQGKVVAAICHGPWLLVESGIADGHEMTSWPSIQTDIVNAGGMWVDEAAVASQGVVTSRKPDDIPAFVDKIMSEMSEGPHEVGTDRRRELGERMLTSRAMLY